MKKTPNFKTAGRQHGFKSLQFTPHQIAALRCGVAQIAGVPGVTAVLPDATLERPMWWSDPRATRRYCGGEALFTPAQGAGDGFWLYLCNLSQNRLIMPLNNQENHIFTVPLWELLQGWNKQVSQKTLYGEQIWVVKKWLTHYASLCLCVDTDASLFLLASLSTFPSRHFYWPPAPRAFPTAGHAFMLFIHLVEAQSKLGEVSSLLHSTMSHSLAKTGFAPFSMSLVFEIW